MKSILHTAGSRPTPRLTDDDTTCNFSSILCQNFLTRPSKNGKHSRLFRVFIVFVNENRMGIKNDQGNIASNEFLFWINLFSFLKRVKAFWSCFKLWSLREELQGRITNFYSSLCSSLLCSSLLIIRKFVQNWSNLKILFSPLQNDSLSSPSPQRLIPKIRIIQRHFLLCAFV